MSYISQNLVRSSLKLIRRRTSRQSIRRDRFLQYLRPALESLESRMLMSADDIISVGRILSSWSTADLQNNELKVTYSVYNQQATPVTGTLLTTKLQSGVTFKSATQIPDQHGQELAWSFGTIPAYGRASVEVTVALASASLTQIDNGAVAFGVVDAAMVTDAAPAAKLRTDVIAPNLLASTFEANTTDPIIQAKAAQLDYDPNQFIQFLSKDIGYESYVGSLRGARGTLWSSAGNSLDEASLGVALFRSSGIPAKYVQGTLSDALSKQLILSMFPASFQNLGYIAPGTTTADPANDPKLLAETRQHYWVQFDTGSGFKDVDTSFANATVGQTFATSQGSFVQVADNLQHKTNIQLVVESYNPGLFGLGGGLSTTTKLDATFTDAELVGRFVSAGQITSTSSLNAIFSQTTNTYSPFLTIGDVAQPDMNSDIVARGIDYQEVLTNFLFGSQIITGVFLRFNMSGPDGNTSSLQYTLADRIGIVARHNGQGANVSVNASGPPLFSPLDVTTFSILGDKIGTDVVDRLVVQAQSLEAEQASLNARLTNPPPTSDPSFAALANESTALLNKALTTATRSQLAQYLTLSDTTSDLFSQRMGVRAYFNTPRITIARAQATGDANSPIRVAFSIDLLKDDIRALAAPGQNAAMGIAFNLVRGQMDTSIESQVLAPLAQSSNLNLSVLVSADSVISTAVASGVRFVLLTPDDFATLESLPLPAAGKALIGDALKLGKSVLTPVQGILINGENRLAWNEIDTTTGASIGVLDNGQHASGFIGYTANLLFTRLLTATAEFGFGLVAGGIYGNLFLTIKAITIAAVSSKIPKQFQGATSKALALADLIAIFKYGETSVEKLNAKTPAFVIGFGISAGWGLQALAKDPPFLNALTDPSPTLPEQSESADALITAASSRPSGTTSGTVSVASVLAAGSVVANWTTTSTGGLPAKTLTSTNATIRDSNGNVIGTGSVSLNSVAPVQASVAGTTSYRLQGKGRLGFFGAAETNLGVGGDWTDYSATLSGNFTVTLTSDSLVLNGLKLPAGKYVISTTAATVSGSGSTSSPSFVTAASLSATGASIYLGPGTGALSVGGSNVSLSNGATLTGYTGTIGLSDSASTTNTVALSGNSTGVLTLISTPAALSANQNSPSSFKVSVQSSFANDYTLSAVAPKGWKVTIDNSGNGTVTPAPGTQSGTFSIQIVAKSKTNPDLLARYTLKVTVSPTLPGISMAVDSDPLFYVPFGGAQVPTAYQAKIRNNGPTVDTFTLTYPSVPSGFKVLASSDTVTIPAGETAVVGVYLVPNGLLPAPGTLVNFPSKQRARQMPRSPPPSASRLMYR